MTIKTNIYSYLKWGWRGTGLLTLTSGRSTVLCLSHSLAQSFAHLLEGWSRGSKTSADGSVLCSNQVLKRQQQQPWVRVRGGKKQWRTSPVFSREMLLQKAGIRETWETSLGFPGIYWMNLWVRSITESHKTTGPYFYFQRPQAECMSPSAGT